MEKQQRLQSLDVLRGADLFLLLICGPLLHTFVAIAGGPGWLEYQIEHVPWHGFVLWDIIMPLFLFMSGITIPFSMARYRQGEKPGKQFWLKLLRRFFLLFFLGWIVQGNLLTLQPRLFHPFANTLQSIAVGYVVTAILFVYARPRAQIIWCVGFFLAYILAFVLTGMNLDPQENIAMLVDKAVLGAHRDGVSFAADGSWSYDWEYQYTWILSSLNFVVTVMLGCFTGQLLRRRPAGRLSVTGSLLVFGAALLLAGLALDPFFPIVKKIWSSSMTLFAGGISVLLMALFYWLIDIKHIWKHTEWLKYFGMNSIAAYFIGETIRFTSIPESLLFGFERWLGPWYPLLLVAGEVTILFLILKVLYKRGIFLKV